MPSRPHHWWTTPTEARPFGTAIPSSTTPVGFAQLRGHFRAKQRQYRALDPPTRPHQVLQRASSLPVRDCGRLDRLPLDTTDHATTDKRAQVLALGLQLHERLVRSRKLDEPRSGLLDVRSTHLAHVDVARPFGTLCLPT